MVNPIWLHLELYARLDSQWPEFVMIPPRHFISTAANAGFSQDADQLMLDMAAKAKTVIISVAADLLAGFPEHISSAILNRMSSQAARFMVR
ncbi:hypothetical protein ACBI01_004447 [Aeromonas veronii]